MSELYRVFIGSMVVTYILHVCKIGCLYKFMHLGRVPSPGSLIFPAFARMFLPHVGALSLLFSFAKLACFSCLATVSELFWKYSTSSKTTIKSNYKSVCTCSQLDYAHSVHMQRVYVCTGHTIHIYIYICIYQRNSTIQLTSVGLAHTRPN